MKFIVTAWVLVFAHTLTNAQIPSINVRDDGMGNATVACASEYANSKNFSFQSNSSKTLLSLSVKSLYLINEISPYDLRISKSVNGNTFFSFCLGRMGNNQFSENYIEGSIGKKLSSILSGGIKICYYRFNINNNNYSNRQFLIPEIAMLVNPAQNIFFGVIIRNPVRIRMDAIEQKKIPATINPGFAITLSRKVKVACSFDETSEKPLTFHSGVEYRYHEQLIVRLGFQTKPSAQTMGVSLKVKNYFLDFSFQLIDIPGNISSVSFNTEF